jgi:hypothetical protein
MGILCQNASGMMNNAVTWTRQLVLSGDFVPADKLDKLGQEGPGNGEA